MHTESLENNEQINIFENKLNKCEKNLSAECRKNDELSNKLRSHENDKLSLATILKEKENNCIKLNSLLEQQQNKYNELILDTEVKHTNFLKNLEEQDNKF
jgi:hypothetical protein